MGSEQVLGSEQSDTKTSRVQGVVYTETVVHAAPAQYAADAPYQLAIIDLEDNGRLTVRILGREANDRVSVGDRVELLEERDGVSYFRKVANSPHANEMPRPLV